MKYHIFLKSEFENTFYDSFSRKLSMKLNINHNMTEEECEYEAQHFIHSTEGIDAMNLLEPQQWVHIIKAGVPPIRILDPGENNGVLLSLNYFRVIKHIFKRIQIMYE